MIRTSLSVSSYGKSLWTWNASIFHVSSRMTTLVKDQHTMSDTMFQLRAERIQNGLSDARTTNPTMVVQDILHVRERVARLLNRGHPDYYAALAELKLIFARYTLSYYTVILFLPFMFPS